MPNQKNYKQTLATSFGGQTQVHRTLVDEQYVIKNEISGFEQGLQTYYNFGLNLEREFVELHFYVPNTNNLVYSAVIPLSEQYVTVNDQNSEDKTLTFQIKYWSPGPGWPEDQNPRDTNNLWRNPDSLQVKYLSGLPGGTYDVVMNFFADEVGTYDDINWRIKKISEDKTELILHARPDEVEGTVNASFTPVDWRDYEQFLYLSMFVEDFRILWLTNILNKIDELKQESYTVLTQDQITVLGLASFNYTDLVEHVLLHIGNNINQFILNEIGGVEKEETETDDAIFSPGGKRFRIQLDRYMSRLHTTISDSVTEHQQSITLNDSGPIPFITN